MKCPMKACILTFTSRKLFVLHKRNCRSRQPRNKLTKRRHAALRPLPHEQKIIRKSQRVPKPKSAASYENKLENINKIKTIRNVPGFGSLFVKT